MLEAPIHPPAADLPLATELTAVFARIQGLLLTEDTVQTALSLVTALAHDTVSLATVGAGVSVLEAAGPRASSAVTGDIVQRVDALQYELDEGPCLEAWASRSMVSVDDTASESRWPRWTSAAEGLGVRSALSAPLVAGNLSLGAIKVYGEQPGAFDDRSRRLLSMFAGQAAVLLANVRTTKDARHLSDDLRQALHGRDVIAMAKGVLMASEHVAEDAAFGLLVSLAQREHRSLQEVAASVVSSSFRRPAVVRRRPLDRPVDRRT